ncbi:MAG: FtsK/SpoIIIE domain-containing protein [Propionibacteriaceae bacterium]|nr:FtsK/SpoIIIE domain-containing protein [Propionibacteriaceae bacterium]
MAESIRLGSATLPLLGQTNIWIEDSLIDDSSIRLTQSIIQQALEGTAPGQLEVTVFDDGLSGLAAPFWPLNSGGEKMLNIINDEQEFRAGLHFFRDHVQGVKNVMQGKDRSLAAFRSRVEYPVEGYKLVVISTDFSFLDEGTQVDLGVLLKAAPSAGVSFLIHSMTLGANPSAVAMCDHMTVKHAAIEREGGDPVIDWTAPTPDDLIAMSQAVADGLASAKMDPLAFTAVQPIQDSWNGTSSDGVTFAIGKYGLQNVEITLGDELNQRHNMLVTGAVGQGKSNLISVIIHSLCQRYSPAEVELYLLDFKEGVTLQPFINAETGEYLPHARVLGLEADREFGLSVLRDLFAVYKRRMKTFKSLGVQNIRQYRDTIPGEEMPRIVVVIDEFQMMFSERDKVSDEIADLLVRGARLFRACGIHIILASQTIGGNMSLMGSTGEGLFGQVPVRVALKNSLAESHATLSDKNDAAAHLRAREAIVNQDYGDVSANRKTSIAFADEAVLAPLRTGWWRRAHEFTRPPYVFVGERKRSLLDDVVALRARPSQPVTAPTVFLGSRIEVDARPLEVPFSRDIGRNIALFGQGEAVVEIESIALSLAMQSMGTRFYVLDCLDGNPSWESTREAFTEMIEQTDCALTVLSKGEIEAFIVDEAERLMDRSEPTDMVLIGLGLDRMRMMPMEFQDIVKTGPSVGVHTIGWWLKMDSFREHVGYGGDAFFDVRLALRLDSQSAKQLVADPLLEWKPIDNRMLAWDSTELAEAIRVIPYTVLDPATVTRMRG